MSLWTKAQQLTGDALQQVRAVYGEHFPIEVRHFLAGWIEEKMWQDIDPNNPAHEPYINELVRSMIQELENKANNMNTEELFLTRLKLSEAANMFRVSNTTFLYWALHFLSALCSIITSVWLLTL